MELIDLLRNWLDEKKERSIPSLAKRCSLAASTIRRIVQREQKATEATARKILREIATPEQFVDVMTTSYPDFSANLQSFYRSFQKKMESDDFETESFDFNDNILDFEIFVMTSNDIGFDANQLVEKLGKKSGKRVEELIRNGALVAKGDKIYSPQKLFFDEKTILKSIENSAKLLQDNLDKEFKGMFFLAERYTENDLKRIGSAARDFVSVITEINLKREREEKTNPAYIGLVFGTTEE